MVSSILWEDPLQVTTCSCKDGEEYSPGGRRFLSQILKKIRPSSKPSSGSVVAGCLPMQEGMDLITLIWVWSPTFYKVTGFGSQPAESHAATIEADTPREAHGAHKRAVCNEKPHTYTCERKATFAVTRESLSQSTRPSRQNAQIKVNLKKKKRTVCKSWEWRP